MHLLAWEARSRLSRADTILTDIAYSPPIRGLVPWVKSLPKYSVEYYSLLRRCLFIVKTISHDTIHSVRFCCSVRTLGSPVLVCCYMSIQLLYTS